MARILSTGLWSVIHVSGMDIHWLAYIAIASDLFFMINVLALHQYVPFALEIRNTLL